ncbi:hypothetical protein BUE80_DR002428 [Diplocarpon rosae]|nr:hypothetical protein BUE80_DR002428 [Diplocarpon rosae]
MLGTYLAVQYHNTLVLFFRRRPCLWLLCEPVPFSIVNMPADIFAEGYMRQPNRLPWPGRLLYYTGKDVDCNNNSPLLPIYPDLEFAGTGNIGVETCKIGDNSSFGVL